MSNGANRFCKNDSVDQLSAADLASFAARTSLPPQRDEFARDTPPTYQLPQNLPNALSHLDNDKLMRLLRAVNIELERRGKKAPIQETIERKRPAEEVPASLAFGRLNAIRAAFKAGVKPSAIARQ